MRERTWLRSSGFRSDNRKSRIQNRKWAGIVAIGITFAMCGAAARAQQPKKVPRIGFLAAIDPARESARSEGIRLALRELGYIEGQNIAIEYRYAEGKFDRLPELAAELVRLKEVVPKLVFVAVFYDPASLSNVFELKEVLPVAAHALRLTIQPWEVRATDDLDRVFAAVGKQRSDGLYVLQGPVVRTNVK